MLKVWIPGTTDARDQGLGGTTWANSGVTIDSSGKLGKCLYSGTSGNMTTSNFSLSTKWSYSCWWKDANTSAGWQYIFLLHNGTQNDTNSQMAFLSYPTQSRCEVCSNGKWYSTQAYTPGTWNHISATYDGTTCKVYFNGIYTTSFTPGQTVIGANLQIFRGANVYLNDLRIWDDEVISAKEIEIISRGLVLHYPLAMPGGANWLYYTNTFQTWPGGSGTTVSDGVASIHTSGSDWNGYIRTSGATAQLIPYSSLKDKVITVSVEAKSNVANGRLDICIGSMNSSGSRLRYRDTWINDISTEWKRVYLTATLNDSFFIHNASAAIGDYIGLWFYTYYIDETIQLRRPKLEICDHVTPWVPHTSDSEYSKIGFSDGIEYDVSGYGHNGTRSGILECSSDTPRYNVSTFFKAGDGIFGHPNITLSQFTIAFWGKHTVINKMLFGSNSSSTNTNSDWYWFGDNSFKFPLGEYYYTHNAGSEQDLLNKWTHFVAIYDGTKLVVYRNGIYEGNKAFTGNVTLQDISIGRGLNTDFQEDGFVSDFRIYSTALSADDVLDLYHTPITLTNNGTLMTQGEFVES